MSIFSLITSEWTLVNRRQVDDLPPKVKGVVAWVEGIGYQFTYLHEGETKLFDVEFINDAWHCLQYKEGTWTTRTGE